MATNVLNTIRETDSGFKSQQKPEQKASVYQSHEPIPVLFPVIAARKKQILYDADESLDRNHAIWSLHHHHLLTIT